MEARMAKNKHLYLIYALTICLGAFLMFFIQPVVGKIVTPKYGGGSQVWCLCLLFFQLALLCGYGLIYFLTHLPLKKQGIIYIILMTISLTLVKVPLSENWQYGNPEAPITSLLSMLIIYLSIPALLLSTVSTIMQSWYEKTTFKNPYHLYSISNIGSLSALVLYPTIIEPNISLNFSLEIWTWAYRILVIFALIAAFLMLRMQGTSQTADITKKENNPLIKRNIAAWLFLSTLGTALLAGFTNHITYDIAPVPLLWMIPLIIYLLSFILCFGGESYYKRPFFVIFGHLSILFLIFLHASLPIGLMLLINLLAFLFSCCILQGELFRLRPDTKHLPLFYLVISIGGALGGIAVNLIAPLLFNDFLEYKFLLLIIIALTYYIALKNKFTILKITQVKIIYSLILAYLLSLSLYAIFFFKDSSQVLSIRNFYGTSKIIDTNNGKRKYLYVGSIKHGGQLIDEKTGKLINTPITYYGYRSAVAIANNLIRIHNNGKPVKMGVIGLGVGSIAAYGEKGDEITFYEIDPKIKKIAYEHFGFLKNSKAKVNVIIGDGRIALNTAPENYYDLLVIDAFSGDYVPIHLLTKDAVEFYLSRIKKDGLIVVHIGNRYIDLNQILSNIALNMNLNGLTITSPANDPYNLTIYDVISSSNWFIDAMAQDNIQKKYSSEVKFYKIKEYPEIGIWTDNYSNLLSVLIHQWKQLDSQNKQ